VTLPLSAAVVVTPESGAIGAACVVPETAATLRVATAIAKAIRLIFLFSLVRTLLDEPTTRQHHGGSTTPK
jgi:hypothetical protein